MSMRRISSKSGRGVTHWLIPREGVEQRAPRGLTVRRLAHYRRYERLRQTAVLVRIEGDHLLCVANLVKLGFDYYG